MTENNNHNRCSFCDNEALFTFCVNNTTIVVANACKSCGNAYQIGYANGGADTKREIISSAERIETEKFQNRM